MAISKAVITAAGFGTRFLPITKVYQKEMLPLLNKPLLQYAVEEAVLSGIRQVVIITNPGNQTIKEYFNRSISFEHVLAERCLDVALEKISGISNLCEICYIQQAEQLGLGHAVLQAEEAVGHEPFVLMLPDDVLISRVPVAKQLMDVYEKRHCSVVGIERVTKSRIPQYGIIRPERLGKRLYSVLDLVEKPGVAEAPSNLGVVGRYVLTPAIFDAIREVRPGKLGEIQLTDAIQKLISSESVTGYRFDAVRFDAGTPLGLLKASVTLALEEPGMKSEMSRYLSRLIRTSDSQGTVSR